MTDGHSHVNYLLIYGALCVLTIVSALADIIHLSSWVLLVAIVFSVATAKALAVMTYFMHLKFEGRWKYVLLAPTTILAAGLPLALLPDIGVHYYTVQVPQQGILIHDAHAHSPGGKHAAGGGHDADHSEEGGSADQGEHGHAAGH